MAHEKLGWKDALQAAKSKGSRPDNSTDQREAKKQATINYKRRKLDKDVKRYIKDNRVLRSRDIEAIGRQHGFYIVGTPFREN